MYIAFRLSQKEMATESWEGERQIQDTWFLLPARGQVAASV